MSGVYRDGKLHLVLRKRELANEAVRVAREIRDVDASLGRSEVRELLDECTVAERCRGRHKKRRPESSRRRPCGWCGNNTYDLSGLTPTEEELALERLLPESLPSRLYRRVDGAIMTSDCGVALPARRRRRWLLPVGALAALLLSAQLWIASNQCDASDPTVRVNPPIGASADRPGTSQAVYK